VPFSEIYVKCPGMCLTEKVLHVCYAMSEPNWYLLTYLTGHSILQYVPKWPFSGYIYIGDLPGGIQCILSGGKNALPQA
jgi:hypothetical protein